MSRNHLVGLVLSTFPQITLSSIDLLCAQLSNYAAPSGPGMPHFQLTLYALQFSNYASPNRPCIPHLS